MPLYYTFKTPMAAVNQNISDQWIYLTFNLEDICQNIKGLMISDGNAASSSSNFWKYFDLTSFERLDNDAIKSVRYGSDSEKRRKKSAELLVPSSLSLEYLFQGGAINETIAQEVTGLMHSHKIQKCCLAKQGWFF